MDPNRVVEVRSSPTDSRGKSKVPISELILCKRNTYNKTISLSVMKKYNSAGYEACYIKLYKNKAYILGTAELCIWFIFSQKQRMKSTRLSRHFLMRRIRGQFKMRR